MAKTKRKKKKRTLGSIIITIILLIVAYFGYTYIDNQNNNANPTYDIPNGTAEFHFIDVGQGDAELIMVGDKNILIDTGDTGAKNDLINYLSDHNVTEIEYFVVTHAHSDHFASATYVVNNYTVKNVIMPDKVATSNMYNTFISALEEHSSINVINANENVGKKYTVNELEMTILAPNDEYTDKNDSSVVIMARYGYNKILLTGDAETTSEKDILKNFSASELDCDVLKVGHHGSDTSSSQAFLDTVKPEIAVICVGEGNKFDHPKQVTLDKLKKIAGLTLYRTDKDGSIVLVSDGEKITKK